MSLPTPDDLPKVTVYITSYNYGAFIEQAIESVLAQTMADFELIIIDDGSTDNSREIIERYRGRPGIIPIFQKNKGLNVTNNIALRAACGRYIVRLDADDWLDAHALEIMSGILDRQPEVGLVFPDYYLVDRDGRVMEQVRRHNFDDVTLMDQPAHGACTMIRRQCLLEVGGYDETFRCQDGYDLWIRFIEHFEVRNVNLPLFYYRQHGDNLTRDEDRILATRSEIVRRHTERVRRPVSTVGIIPVRGPKADPSSPALKPLGGKALIDWTIEAALGARRLAAVLVTSPDDDLLDHVRAGFGDKVITVHRDPSLALFNTYLSETLKHALEVYEAGHPPVDAVMQLAIESPLRAARHIDAAVEVMELFEVDAVIGVRPELDGFYRHDGRGLTPLRQSSFLRLEQEEVYRDAGQIRLLTRQALHENNGTLKGRVGHVVVDQRAALRLRSRFDWVVVESLLETIRTRLSAKEASLELQ
jgi:CMP-N-acetylneuraminic acid synthetase